MQKELDINGGLVIKESIVGGKITNIKGQERADVKISYFKGGDQPVQKNNIPVFTQVDLGEVYDGIELKLKAYGSNVEKLFYVKPGSATTTIKLKVNGVDKLKVNKDGELEMETNLGIVSFTKPVAYQEEAGKKKYVSADYVINGNEYGFVIGDYNKNEMLIIDPLLAATFIGGSVTDDDYEPSIELDPYGNVYASG